MFKLLFIIFIISGVANAEMINICLKNSNDLNNAKLRIKDILHTKDQVFIRESTGCLEFIMGPKRLTLYNTYLSKFYSLRNVNTSLISGTEQEASYRNCRFKYIKESHEEIEADKYKIGRNGKIKKSLSKSKANTRGSIVVTEGKWGLLHVNNSKIYVTCKKIGYLFEVEVSLSEKDSSLSTSVNISKGQRITLGAIVNNLRSRDSSISLSQGYGKNKTRGKEAYSYFLILN
jgi:hypothetical protein